MASKHIRVCLFFIELSAAIGISMLTLVLLKLFHCGSWSVRLSSTFAILWIIKAVANFFSTESQKNDLGKSENDTTNRNHQDVLKNFETREQHNNMHFEEQGEKDDAYSSPPKQSAMMVETKEFLEEEAEGQDNAKISFSLISILAAVFLQLAIRLLVIAQNFTLTFRRRRRRAAAGGTHGLKTSLLNIPFTIGRSLSPSGVSFYIFSFLNNFLGGEGFDAEDDGDDMAMKALSFDHISTNSSSIWIRPLRKHSSTTCQLSWLGLCFGDIELSLTLLLRRKRKHVDSDTNPCIRSVTIQMKIDSFVVGLFPRVFDWVECSGVTIDASAAIDSNNTTNSKNVGVSLQLSKLHVYQVASTLRKIVSWGQVDFSCEANNRRTTVAVLSIPGGFAAVGNSMEMHLDGKVAVDSMVSKKAIVHIGSSTLGCRTAVGINLEELPSFMQTLEILLKNMLSCFDKSNLIPQKVANTARSKPKSSTQLIELCVSSNIHAYTILSSSNRLTEGQDVLSFRVARASALLRGESDLNDKLMRCRIGAGMLRYEVTDDSAPALDLVSIKHVATTLEQAFYDSDRVTQRALSVTVGQMVVRVGANNVMELSSCMKIANDIKLASTSMQNDLKQFKLGLPDNGEQNAAAKIEKRKQNDQDRIEVLVDDVDMIVELNAGSVREGSVVANDDRVRFAVLLRKAIVNIVGQRRLSTLGPFECDSIDDDPRQLFGSKLYTHGASFLIETAASCVEAFVTYSPHISLPVFDCNYMNVPNEVSFYAQANTFSLQTIVPSRTTRSEATTLLTKAMMITFDEVSLFERAQSGIGVMSLFATSVHEFHFNPNESPWAMINAYNRVSPLPLTKIAQGTGEFCLTESRNHTSNEVEKDETISVRLRKGSSDVELAWSPVFQWIQMSFNKRLQAALAYLRCLIVGNEKGSSVIPIRQNTRVHVGVDSNVTARMNMYVGVKSTVLLAIDGGFDVSISITKYPSVHPPIQLKPSICLQAGHIEAFLNGSQSPILVTDGFVFQNNIRRANEHEIDEYLRKKETDPTSGDIQNEIATDIDGHPLKEIFHLNIGTCATVKLPPRLFLGDVIDDFNLLPKSLDIGMNSLNENGAVEKRVKRYQLLTIECIIPSLSISLLDVDIDAENLRLREEVSLFIEAGKLTIERNTPPELTQQQINNIDEDNSSQYNYGPVVQGGDMKLSISHLMFNVHPLTIAAPMVRIGNFSINGCLFLAGLSPTTPGIKESVKVNYMLLCHHRGNCCCPYGVSVDASGIPVKVYTDSIIHCDELDVNYGPVMGPSMPRLQECFKRILPSPKDGGGQDPLTWWDNIRFAVHGPIALCVDKLSFRWLLDSHIFQDKSIYLACADCTLDYKESFSLDAINVDVSMPGVPYDTSMHPSESFNEPDFCLPHQMESIVGKGRHPLLFVPQLSTKMTFLWKMLNPGKQPYQHHSIYLNCEDDDTSDKFASFRSDGYFVDLSFELPGGMAGSDDVCNWIALRIDVLPWFTHLNSTVDYSSLHDDERQDPIPKFLSLAMNININQLKVAAWYEEEEAADSMTDGGLCLIVRQVEYKATLDDVKEIVLDGPVKAARLNVSGFTQPDKSDESGSMSEMAAIEVIADDFGSSWKTELCYNNGSQSLLEEDGSSSGTSTPFWRLEQLSCDIDELDYIVTTDQIDICNQSLAKILAGSDKERMAKEEEPMYADLDRTTWSILVSRLKILWTLEIRDCIMAISKDLIFVIGYMKSQVRQMHTLADRDATSTDGRHLSTTPMNLNESLDFTVANSVGQDTQDGLQYLLRRNSSWGMYSDVSGAHENDERSQHFEAEETRNSTLPTLDIHFSNPQVQLHSKSTGGSVILAMEGAHIEGKKFVKFLVANSHPGQMSPADLIRKTEHIYTLTNMEAYSLNSQIDISVGLPWLEVDFPAPGERILPEPTRLGVLFGISSPRQAESKSFPKQNSSNSLDGDNMSAADNYEWKYPPELRHHEPFAFREQKNIRPILNKFTCLSRQLFYRPPIHYSNEELKSFISQGLVIEQNGTIADNIDLEIDLLQFNLDSYQFKTTIDLIRNVLLKPPKPHRRIQNLIQLDEEDGADTRANRMSSPEVFEMESALWAARARRASGKKERAALRSPAMKLSEDLERRIELYGDQMIRRVSYKLSKLVWCVQSQGQIDDVQIAFTGFQGEHSYMASGALKTQISLEDLRVTSPKPGPDSMSFPDPTSVLKPVLGSKRSPCQRCGNTFSHSINGLEACRFHWGRFSEGKWSCCQATTSNAPGCKTAPHTGKERTAVVRVEALPPVVEGISLYSHLEVNIFPSVPHTLSVQISKSISRLFMDYFFIGQDDDDDDDTQSISTDVTGSTDAMSVRSDATPRQTARRKSLLIGGKGIGISNQPIKEEISRNDSYDQEEQRQLREQQQQQLNEMFFIKFLRVGYVNVESTLGGFRALPQTTLNICVRDYTKAYKIGSTAYLGQKYLYYLIHEVLKSGASSALRRKKMTTSAVADTDTDVSKEETNAQAERKLMPAVSPSRAARRAAAESKSVGVEDIIGSPIKKSAKKKKRFTLRRSNF